MQLAFGNRLKAEKFLAQLAIFSEVSGVNFDVKAENSRYSIVNNMPNDILLEFLNLIDRFGGAWENNGDEIEFYFF